VTVPRAVNCINLVPLWAQPHLQIGQMVMNLLSTHDHIQCTYEQWENGCAAVDNDVLNFHGLANYSMNRASGLPASPTCCMVTTSCE